MIYLSVIINDTCDQLDSKLHTQQWMRKKLAFLCESGLEYVQGQKILSHNTRRLFNSTSDTIVLSARKLKFIVNICYRRIQFDISLSRSISDASYRLVTITPSTAESIRNLQELYHKGIDGVRIKKDHFARTSLEQKLFDKSMHFFSLDSAKFFCTIFQIRPSAMAMGKAIFSSLSGVTGAVLLCNYMGG